MTRVIPDRPRARQPSVEPELLRGRSGVPGRDALPPLAPEPIKGDKGDKGDQGERGPPGDQGLPGENGDNGWSPSLAVKPYGERRVLGVIDWFGGTGDKPTVKGFLGPQGLVQNESEAIDIRGPAGPKGFDGFRFGGGGGGGGIGLPGDDGWSPVFAAANDGDRVVLQIHDWVGGAGDKPVTGDYVGATGLTSSIADGVDVRGSQGEQGLQGADGADGAPGADGNDGWTPIFSVVSDGERRVLQVSGWIGEGTPPPTGSYVSATGLTDVIANAVDIRGPQGIQGDTGPAGSPDTAEQVLAKLVTVDGAGSGLDADLLDGQSSAFYTDIVARLGFTPVQQGGGVGQGTNKIYIGWSAAGLKLTVDVSDLGNFWLSSNDGAGSGLDADLVDGLQASALLSRANHTGTQPNTTITGLGTASVKNTGASGDAVPLLNVGNTWSVAQTFQYGSIFSAGGDHTGGAFLLVKPPVGSTLAGNVIVDLFDNRLRMYEVGGTFRGVFVDLTGGAAGAVATLWHSSNDGAGSGLDADLLDGLDSSYYANIPARLGYTPLNKAGDTMQSTLGLFSSFGENSFKNGNADAASYTQHNVVWKGWWGVGLARYDDAIFGYYDFRTGTWDVKTAYKIDGVPVWHPGNDGAGSGLDADLLDGLQSTYFTDIPSRLGFTPVQQGTGIGQFGNTVKLGWSGSELKATVDAVDLGFLWVSAHAPSNVVGGHQQLPSGLILQWGTVAAGGSANTNVSFPVAFPNVCVSAQITQLASAVGNHYVAAKSTAGITINSGSANPTVACDWFAVGY